MKWTMNEKEFLYLKMDLSKERCGSNVYCCHVTIRTTGVATEDYLLLVGEMRQSLIPPLTIDNPPWLRP